jgi:DNA helicase MCM8
MSKSVSDNLRMNTALLSRFDLIFVLRDRPNEELDRQRSAHVIAMQIGGSRKPKNVQPVPRYFSQERAVHAREEDDDNGDIDLEPLSERLRIGADDDIDLIPPSLIRKYIAYARKYIHPRLSEEVLSVIKQYYLEWRRSTPAYSELSTPVTTRQLESIVRLSEARAKMSLRHEVTIQDALDVLEIM